MNSEDDSYESETSSEKASESAPSEEEESITCSSEEEEKERKYHRPKAAKREKSKHPFFESPEALLESIRRSGRANPQRRPPIPLSLLKGTLKKHQEEGLKWLVQIHDSPFGGILADEMGLGKTIQAIALLCSIAEQGDPIAAPDRAAASKRGPYLVLAPLSTVANWASEFQKFAPSFRVLCYGGEKAAREQQREEIAQFVMSQNDKSALATGTVHVLPFDVLVTNYELAIQDVEFLRRFHWTLGIVDEGHRLKNCESVLYRTLQHEYRLPYSVLLTGTPIQNNLQELHSLLRFVAPRFFSDAEAFIGWFRGVEEESRQGMDMGMPPDSAQQESEHDGIDSMNRLALLHAIIQPFMLRRTKTIVADELPALTEYVVYTGLSRMQKMYYRSILSRGASYIEIMKAADGARMIGDAASPEYGSSAGDSGDKAEPFSTLQLSQSVRGLQGTLMQLRKCCGHPYLFEGAEPEPFQEGDHLFENCGKLLVLDALLPRLQADGHRVLLFSQMTRILDIVQDYLSYKGWSYERLDGSVRAEERKLAIQRFTTPGLDDGTGSEAVSPSIFLLSTRAGGLGINLVAADTVIFYDSDFNPQMDLQAMARAHRYGQTKDVRVFRLVTKDTVEEIMLQRSLEKLRLQHTVIEQAGLHGKGTVAAVAPTVQGQTSQQWIALMQHGLRTITGNSGEECTPTADADTILAQAQRLTLIDSAIPRTARPDSTHPTKTSTPTGPPSESQSHFLASHDLSVDQPPCAATASPGAVVSAPPSSMRVFEGVDYEKVTKERVKAISDDGEALQDLLAAARREAIETDAATSSGARLSKAPMPYLPSTSTPKPKAKPRPKKPLTAEEKEARAAQREQRAAETKAKRERDAALAKQRKWERNNYRSLALSAEDNDAEPSHGDVVFQTAIQTDDQQLRAELFFKTGDATIPQIQTGLRAAASHILLNAVDASGRWGRGGFFSALDQRFGPLCGEQYETAGRNEDLLLGQAHLMEVPPQQPSVSASTTPPRGSGSESVGPSLYVCHMVVLARIGALGKQIRAKPGKHGLHMDPEALGMALRSVFSAARAMNADVHTPRLGAHDAHEWYAIERLFRRYVVEPGVNVSVYYKPRHDTSPSTALAASTSTGQSVRTRKKRDKHNRHHRHHRNGSSSGQNRRDPADVHGQGAKRHKRGHHSSADHVSSDLRPEASKGSSATTATIRSGMRDAKVFFHRILNPSQGQDLQRSILQCGGEVAHFPNLHCVRTSWITACSQHPTGWVDPEGHRVRTGMLFRGTRVAVAVKNAAQQKTVVQDIVTYGGAVFMGVKACESQCHFLVTDEPLWKPEIRTLLQDTPGVKAVLPGWVGACIDANRVIADTVTLEAFDPTSAPSHSDL